MTESLITLNGVYNHFLIDMVRNLKDEFPKFRKVLSGAGHKAIDPSSSTYIRSAAGTLPVPDILTANDDEFLTSEAIGKFEPLPGVKLADALALPEEGKKNNLPVNSYILILSVLALTFKESTDDEDISKQEENDDPLIKNVLHVLTHAQNGDIALAGAALDGIVLNGEIVTLLERIAETSAQLQQQSDAADAADGAEEGSEESKTRAGVDGEGSSEGGGPGTQESLDAMLKAMESSVIGDIAKEISSELDISKLTENPAELFDLKRLSDADSPLGSIISKVGSKIQTKLASGELDQGQMLKDAMSMLGVMQGMGGGGGKGGLGGLAGLAGMMGGVGGGGGGSKKKSGGMTNNVMDAILKTASANGIGNAGAAASILKDNHRSGMNSTQTRLRNKMASRTQEKNK